MELVEIAGGWQFRTAPDLAPRLVRVVQQPRRLPRVAMETLAIVAYHQPVTRAEIEEIGRGALPGDAGRAAGGRADGAARAQGGAGRPTLWGTTPAFLARFGLADLGGLPRREDLLVEPPVTGAGRGGGGYLTSAAFPAKPRACSTSPGPRLR